MENRIVLASSNKGKLAEFREILTPLGYEIVSPKDLGLSLDVEENGKNYRENSYIKALAIAKQIPLPVIADDSGIEIAGLDNGPGLHSARFAEAHGGYPAVFAAVLKALQGKKDRSARFVCCICYLENKNAKPLYFEGICPGRILEEPQGEHGFGYDPLFHSDEANEDFGTASAEIKNRFSHRGKAIAALKKHFAS